MYFLKNYLEKLERKRAYSDRLYKKNYLLLDRNEKFIPLDQKLKKKLIKRLSKINPGLYPNISSFYKKLSKWIGLPRENIFLTEGVSGAIKNIIECYTLPGKNNIVFPYPTFAMYPVYCDMFNVQERKIGYTKNYELKQKLKIENQLETKEEAGAKEAFDLYLQKYFLNVKLTKLSEEILLSSKKPKTFS